MKFSLLAAAAVLGFASASVIPAKNIEVAHKELGPRQFAGELCSQPGTYYCAVQCCTNNILVCTLEGRLAVAAHCGEGQYCQDIGFNPYCMNYRKRDETEAMASNETNIVAFNEADAPAPGEIVSRGSCTPGTYSCDPSRLNIINVCDGSGNQQFAAECGHRETCVLNHINNSPYCKPVGYKRDSDGVAPAKVESETRAEQGSIIVQGLNPIQAENWNCKSGTYTCGSSSANPEMRDQQALFVCNSNSNWQLAGWCDTDQACETINNVSYCV